jgi:hypothetical protein
LAQIIKIKRDFVNILKLGFSLSVFLLLAGCSANSASVRKSISPIDGKERTDINRYAIPGGMTISIPSSWDVQGHDKLVKLMEDATLKIENSGIRTLTPVSKLSIPFRAETNFGLTKIVVNVTVSPPEVSQKEVNDSSDTFLLMLGDIFKKQYGQASKLFGGTNLKVSKVRRLKIGNKTAIQTIVSVTTGEGTHMLMDKYYFYTEQKTAIVTIEMSSKADNLDVSLYKHIAESFKMI